MSIRGSIPTLPAPFVEGDSRASTAEYEALFALPPPVDVQADTAAAEPGPETAQALPTFAAFWRRVRRRGQGASGE